MAVKSKKGLEPDYLRLQADRCQRLSRSCVDLGTARDLRLMAEEYFSEATKFTLETPCTGPVEITSR
jgi:hypothetical protein